MSAYGTKFVESEAILAAQDGNLAEVQRIIGEMLPSERRALLAAAERLAYEIRLSASISREGR